MIQTEDNLVQEDLENRSDTYSELALSLYKYTDKFTKEGAYPTSDRAEAENAYEILSQYYDNVRKGVDTTRSNAEDGADYKIFYRNPKDIEVEESLTEAIEKHDELNKDLFDGDHMRPEVKDKIMQVVDVFMGKLKEDGIELEPLDVLVLGSNASYNYTEHSDIDVHIIADTSIYEDKDALAIKLYNAYRQIFNSKYDPMIRGHELEMYVEPDECNANSNGIYSVMNDDWVKVPEKKNIPEPDMKEVNKLLEPFEARYKEAETIEDIDQLINDIYIERQAGILTGGEYDIRNQVFKEFRNKGFLDDLKQRKIDLETKEMSLEERSKMEDYKFDLHGAIEQMKAINEDFQQPAPELTDELKDYLHRALDDWYDSKVKNRFDPQVNNMVATYSAQGGDPVDTVNMVDDDAYLKGIVTDYAMGDNDTAKTVADYSLRYLNDKMNPPIQEEAEPKEEEPHFVDNRLAAILGYGDDYGYDEYDLDEAKDKWRETPYGFSELDYNGFVISKHGPSSMIGFGYPFSVDFYGDEVGFDTLEDAKAAIDQEVNESLNECGDGATQSGDMGQFNTNILDWGIM